MRHRERYINEARVVPIFGGIEHETMDDDPTFSKTPAWKPMSKQKVRIKSSSPCSYSYSWRDSWTGNWFGPVNVYSGDSYKGPSGFIGVTTIPSFPTANLQTGFIWDAIKKYGKSDVNIGAFLGELRETVEMFHRPWSLVANIASGKFKVPKGLKTVKGVVEFVSNEYLEYRYGIRPFISDVKGFTRLSARLDEKYRAGLAKKPTTLKAFRNQSLTESLSGKSDIVSSPAHLVQWDNSATLDIKRCEWCLVESNPSAAARGLASKFASSMHLSDLATIAWELTPYSFIADWFLPIGDTIADLTDSPANLVSVSTPWQWTETVLRAKISNSGFAAPNYISDITFGYEVESASFSRSFLGALPPKPSTIDGFQKLDLALIVGQTLGGLFGKSFRR